MIDRGRWDMGTPHGYEDAHERDAPHPRTPFLEALPLGTLPVALGAAHE
jgi:hypothetical protein